MRKLLGVVILFSMQMLSVYAQSNRFDFDNWTNGSTDITNTVGTCTMRTQVNGSSWNPAIINHPYKDGALAADPTNGSGLALDHNWANKSTSTTVTLTFNPAILNPTFSIYDINRNNACYSSGCSGAWTDRVTVNTNNGTVSASAAQPSEQTINNSGTATVTVLGNSVCGGVNGAVNFSVSGSPTVITITYSSGTTVDVMSLAPLPNTCATGGQANCLSSRSACTDPGRQYITIGSISGSTCCLGSPVAQRDIPTGAQCSGTALNFSSAPGSNNGTLSYSWTSNNPAGTTGTGSSFSFTPTNNTCADITLAVTAGITSNVNTGVNKGQTVCNAAFSPTIKPIPTISLDAVVNCSAATVVPNGAQLCGSPCASCSYTLQSCTGCVSPSTSVGTTSSSGTAFTLYGANAAGFSATLNGCSSATQSLNFLAAPYNCTTPLSAELNEFTVDCAENSTQLKWVTSSEQNNEYFTIERSSDGSTFELLKEVSASGSTNFLSSYSVNDDRPLVGLSYYRLSQTDYDGSNTVLGTLSSEWPCTNLSNGILLFPNPTDGDVNLVIIHNYRENYSVQIFDAIGQLVLPVIEEKFEEQAATMLKVKTSDLSAGIFLIKVVVGDKVYTEKLVIKK